MTQVAQPKSLVAATDVPTKEEAPAKQIIAERFKTKMCRTYVKTGTCPYESRCMFAHGTHELRTKQMNLADGLVTEEAVKAFQRKARVAQQAAQEAKQPPAYSSYSRAAGNTNTMGVVYDDEQQDEVASQEQDVAYPGYSGNNSSSYGSYSRNYSEYSGYGYYPAYSSYSGTYTGPYADYEGPCMCDECIRARAAPCECDECQAAALALVCDCDDCAAARDVEKSSTAGSDDVGAMMP